MASSVYKLFTLQTMTKSVQAVALFTCNETVAAALHCNNRAAQKKMHTMSDGGARARCYFHILAAEVGVF